MSVAVLLCEIQLGLCEEEWLVDKVLVLKSSCYLIKKLNLSEVVLAKKKQ